MAHLFSYVDINIQSKSYHININIKLISAIVFREMIPFVITRHSPTSLLRTKLDRWKGTGNAQNMGIYGDFFAKSLIP